MRAQVRGGNADVVAMQPNSGTMFGPTTLPSTRC